MGHSAENSLRHNSGLRQTQLDCSVHLSSMTDKTHPHESLHNKVKAEGVLKTACDITRGFGTVVV